MLLEFAQNAYHIVESHPKTSLALAAALFLVFELIVVPFYISPLRKVPGPYFHRVSAFAALNGQRSETWINRVAQLHACYGEIVLLSPLEVSVNGNHKYINDIYVKNFPKSRFYENFRNHGFRDNIFASLENDRHLKYKKMILSLYSKSAVFLPKNSTRQAIIDCVSQLVRQVRISSVEGTQPDHINARSAMNEHGKGHLLQSGAWLNTKKLNIGMDMYPLFGALAMDVVSGFELGQGNGSRLLHHPEQRHIIVSHRIQLAMVFWTTLMPFLWDWVASPETREALAKIETWQLQMYERAEKRATSSQGNPSTMETLHKHGLQGKDAYSFLSDNIFAGHETTAVQLTYLTYELSRPANFRLQKRLVDELQGAFGVPKNSEDIISDLETVDQLPFLNALLLENGRVHTSIPGAEPRVVATSYSVKVGNVSVTLPKGTIISCQPYSVHRASVFENPDDFKPERWLQGDETEAQFHARIKLQNRYMMPFGKGIRMCLGMQIALIEMKMAIANLYWHYGSKICPDWCEITIGSEAIKLGGALTGNSTTDQQKMVMVDTYTTRPYNDECWLEWYNH